MRTRSKFSETISDEIKFSAGGVAPGILKCAVVHHLVGENGRTKAH